MKIFHSKQIRFITMILLVAGFVITSYSIYEFANKNNKINSEAFISNQDISIDAITVPELVEVNSIGEFSIPELDFSMKLPEKLIGLRYSIDNSNSWGPVAYLASSEFEKIDKDSQCNYDGSLGVIWRVPQDPKTIKGSGVTISKQLGESYIAYQRPQGLCSSDDNMIDLQLMQIKLIQQAVNNASAAK